MSIKLLATSVAALSVVSMAATVNTKVWFDGTKTYVTPTVESLEADATNQGYWFDFDDRKYDHGGSCVFYPSDTTGYFGSFPAAAIGEQGYMSVAYKLADPVAMGQTDDYPYNFAGIGFNLNGPSGTLDITSSDAFDGLCVTYTSGNTVTLEIDTDDAKNADCAIYLPKTDNNAFETQNLPFKNFKQPIWAKGDLKVASCAASFAKAKAIKFKIDGGAMEGSGIIRVLEIGPAGTCGKTSHVSGYDYYAFASDGNGSAIDQSNQYTTCPEVERVDSPADKDAIEHVKVSSAPQIQLSGRTLSFGGVSDVNFEIANTLGQVVMKGHAASSISLASLQAGIYMVRVNGNNLNMTQKINVK